jgi:hypothetical protein
MPRRTALQVALENLVLDVIADEARESERQARQSRQSAAEAEAARLAGASLAPLRERVGEIEEQIGRLRRMYRKQGDARPGG